MLRPFLTCFRRPVIDGIDGGFWIYRKHLQEHPNKVGLVLYNNYLADYGSWIGVEADIDFPFPFCPHGLFGLFISKAAKIGKNCVIHANVSIYAHTVIGDDVIIHSGASIGADAYYFQKRKDGWKKLESCGRTIVGDKVEVGANTCIDKGVSGDTFIGKGVKFDNQVQVGHDTHIGDHCLIGAQCAIAGCTYIDDDCNIWARACVNKDLYIAKRTTILALSAVDKSVKEEGQTLFGQPAVEARKAWREMASVRMLPAMMEEFEKLKKEVEALKR